MLDICRVGASQIFAIQQASSRGAKCVYWVTRLPVNWRWTTRDVFAPWPWHDLDVQTWPKYCDWSCTTRIPRNEISRSRILKVGAWTGQTDRQTRPSALPATFARSTHQFTAAMQSNHIRWTNCRLQFSYVFQTSCCELLWNSSG